MEPFFSRYRNLIVLLAALLLQVIGLAVQVRKAGPNSVTVSNGLDRGQKDGRGVLLIRLWAASLVTPFERAAHGSGEGVNNLWNEYIDLRRTHEQNKELQQTVDRLRLEQAELREDALQGQRLQALVKFRENYIYQTLPAQVIGTSGSRQSHVVYLDKGSADGLAPDMAVITSDGIVGKVRDVFPHSVQVLLINDQTSGAGVILETTRIRGILRGNVAGQPQVINILADQRIQPGEHVLTAGGDQIFPRGLPVGVVEKVERDPERGSFINVIIKPSANLDHLEEVLVVTSLDAHLSPQQQADLATSEDLKGAEVAAEAARKKAALEMEQRLPGLKDPNAPDSVAPAKLGPDGKPVPAAPVVPVIPKPLPVLHADRFSANHAEEPAGGGTGETSDEPAPEDPAPVKAETTKRDVKPQKDKLNPAKPAPKAPQFSGRAR
jgi:rod shape-determining protein MreC